MCKEGESRMRIRGRMKNWREIQEIWRKDGKGEEKRKSLKNGIYKKNKHLAALKF